MAEESAKEKMNKALFANLIMMLSSSSMQQLGKLVNPVTNKTEINLEGAQITIDMLDMIKDKTKGNLSEDEDKMLNDVLSSLQMNFVEVSKSAPDRPEEKPEEKKEEKSDNKETREEEKGAETRDPKFHKSYGD